MWTTKHTAETELSVEEVWNAVIAIHRGEVVAPGGDVFELDGPLEVGAEVSVTPAGQETFRSRVIELEDNATYADETHFGDVVLVFRHTLEPTSDGARVSHELVIDGPGADETGPVLGPQISDDFPEAMQGLFQVAVEAEPTGAVMTPTLEPGQSPGFLMWHLSLAWQREVTAALSPLGLTHVQFVLLACTYWLTEHGREPNQLDVARQAGTDVKMTSQVVRRLEARALIVRQPDPADSRAKLLTVTTEGRRLARRAITVVEAADAEFFGRYPASLTKAILLTAR